MTIFCPRCRRIDAAWALAIPKLWVRDHYESVYRHRPCGQLAIGARAGVGAL